MVTRRTVLACFGFLAAMPAGMRPARADSADDASAFINNLLHDLIAIVDGPGSIEDKRAALVKIVDATVDVKAVARFCLGRFWRTATEAQRHDYTELFHHVLVVSVTGKVGEYKGVTFTVGRGTARDDEVAVPTVVTWPGKAPNKVDWLVSTASGSPKLIDISAEGISLRLTQRDDYASYLARNNNNVQALIDAIRQQAVDPPG
jgi:phospholipid transport system substrate-binding protein